MGTARPLHRRPVDRSALWSLLATTATSAALVGAAVVGDLTTSHPKPFPAHDYAGLPAPRPSTVLPGTNFTHYAFRHCSWNDTDVLTSYGLPGVRQQVHRELRIMRLRGVQTLRTLIWHMSDPGPNRWGPVPSAGGRLPEPYRTNLIEYLREVRRFHFRRLTVAFGPQWTNNPIGPRWRSSKLRENWHFIEDVRALVKQYGPRDSRFDLLNEGAPSNYLAPALQRRMRSYDRRIYAAYVRRYGNRDVTISVIGPVSRYDYGNRLQNLIYLLRSTGMPLPTWFEIHSNQRAPEVLHALEDSDAVLRRNGLRQPLTLGEVSYDDPGVASVIRTFGAESGGRLDEVLQWYHRAGHTCNGSPPYRVDAYRALQRR